MTTGQVAVQFVLYGRITKNAGICEEILAAMPETFESAVSGRIAGKSCAVHAGLSSLIIADENDAEAFGSALAVP